jgi:hypothetical protein
MNEIFNQELIKLNLFKLNESYYNDLNKRIAASEKTIDLTNELIINNDNLIRKFNSYLNGLKYNKALSNKNKIDILDGWYNFFNLFQLNELITQNTNNINWNELLRKIHIIFGKIIQYREQIIEFDHRIRRRSRSPSRSRDRSQSRSRSRSRSRSSGGYKKNKTRKRRKKIIDYILIGYN